MMPAKRHEPCLPSHDAARSVRSFSAASWAHLGIGAAVFVAAAAVPRPVAAKSPIDYFTPTPIISPLSSTCWGANQVGSRDQSNGLEDKSLADWNYWDGGIIKDDQTGTYHMFASRWKQSDGHGGWQYDSHCTHATSDNLFGPYTDQGQCFTDNGGMCHNVNALKLKTGDTSGKKFAITCSGGVGGSGRAYGADSLDGPWTYLGDIQLDLNGYSGEYSMADNFRTILRPDGKYECMNSRIGLADNVLGPYKAQMANNFTNTVPGSPTTNMEDPSIFYAGGVYHVIYHCWSTGLAYLYTSQDGIHNWTMEPGIAYDPSTNMVRYTDGTVNHWPLLERSSAYIENGHVVAMTFAAIDVQKADDKGNDGNGSKVIVVPFDGELYDSDNGNGGEDAGWGDGGLGGSDGGVDGGASDGARLRDDGGIDGGGLDRDASAVSDGAVAADAGRTTADAGAWGDAGKGEVVLGSSCGTAENRATSAGISWLAFGLVVASMARRRQRSR